MKKLSIGLICSTLLFFSIFSFYQTAQADLTCCDVMQDLSLDIGGVRIEGPEGFFDQFANPPEIPPTPVLDGNNISAPSQTIKVNFLEHFRDDGLWIRAAFGSAVPEERGVYLLSRVASPESPGIDLEEHMLTPDNFSLIHQNIPANDGESTTQESTLITFSDLPAFGSADAQPSKYRVVIADLPEVKYTFSNDTACEDGTIQSPEWEEVCQLEEPYTDEDFKHWYKWSYFDNETFNSDFPDVFSPQHYVSFEFEYTAAAASIPDPVIIIPGIAGTELYNGNDLVWPDLIQMKEVNDYFLTENLNLDSQGNSIVSGIKTGNVIEKILDVPIFGLNIFEDLRTDLEANSYQENQNLFFFPYDWRLDLNGSKDLLKQKIDEVKTQTGKDKVNIIVHSMGGLLVKDYLNQYGKESIDKLVFVGTPHLGAPKAGKVLLEGDRFGIPWLEEDRIKEIAENSPALHELLPNQKYFDVFQGYFRKYNFFGNNPLLNYTETKDFFLDEKDQNPVMFQKTEDFQDKNLENFDFSGVETYNIAGCKTGTQAAYSFDIFGGIGQTGYTSGDGTVPLVSADYINIPSENKYYVKNGSHAELPSANGVRDLILGILENNRDNLAGNVSNDSSYCNFKGKKLTWHSPVEIHIYDSEGNHTGPIENNTIEYGIPGIDYDVMGHNKFVFLPTDGEQEYLVEAKGLEEGSFDLSVSEVENDQYLTTKIFNDVPVTTSTTASFAVNNEPNNSIEVEDQGNIVEVPADATLNGEQVLDLTPPETKAEVKQIKDKKQKKSLQITLSATDNQSGILETAYSLDEGKTFSIYSKPIIVEKKIDKIWFYSIDKAGNNEEVKEFDMEKNKPDKCKSWRCLDINKKHNVIKKIYKKLKNHSPINNLKLRHK